MRLNCYLPDIDVCFYSLRLLSVHAAHVEGAIDARYEEWMEADDNDSGELHALCFANMKVLGRRGETCGLSMRCLPIPHSPCSNVMPMTGCRLLLTISFTSSLVKLLRQFGSL